MHELSLAEGIVRAVVATAQREGITRVRSVRVAVGELAGVDIAALQFAWRSVSRTLVLQGATLQIEVPPGEAWCLDCAQTVRLARLGNACPRCGGNRLLATGGRELKVLDFEGTSEAFREE